MTMVSDHKENRISTGTLTNIVKEYIPSELLRHSDPKKLRFGFLDFVEDDGEKLLQSIMDISNHQLRMYGSARELAENLKTYRSFTGNMKKFEADFSDPYSTTPTVYCSLSNKEYICKQDIFIHLQDLILKNFPFLGSLLPHTLILIFLKKEEARLNSCFEFIQYDKDEFEKLEAEIATLKDVMSDMTNNHFPKSPMYMLKLTDCGFAAIFNQFKTLIPSSWKEKKYNAVKVALKLLYDNCDPKKEPNPYKHVYYNLSIIFPELRNIINKRPHWFLPNDESEEENRHLPVQLRLFEDNGEQFVMVREVFDRVANNISELKQYMITFEDGEEDVAGFQTISYDEMKQKFPKQWKKIEFIRVPIIRAKHRAVPIMTPVGEHFLLASDVLFELLRKMIFGPKIFQKAKNTNDLWKIITAFFTDIEHYFKTSDPIYFIDSDSIDTIKQLCDGYFSKYVGQQKPLAKDVRNAKKDGFTLENLVNELNNLTLPDAFPNITDHAKIVYQHVLENKKEEFLRTCDLFDAVEMCQMICIFKKFPKLAKFLHSQKSCHRILNQCDLCCPPAPEKNAQKYKDVREKLAKHGKAEFDFDGATVSIRGWDPKKSLEENMQCSTCDEESCKSHQKMQKSTSRPSMPQKVSKVNEKIQKKMESCNKCSQNAEEYDKLKKELVTSLNQTETFKKKATERASELASLKRKNEKKQEEEENQMKAQELGREQELEQLKLQLADAKNDLSQIEEARKKEKKSFDESKAQLTELQSGMEKQLAESEKKNQNLEQEVKNLQEAGKILSQKLEDSLQEQNRLKLTTNCGNTNELREQNMRLSIQLEEKEKTIDKLLNKLVMSSK